MKGWWIIKKEEKVNKTKRLVWDIIFWVIIVSLTTIWVIDFIQVKRDKEPVFCLKETIHTYDDGTVNECVGLGYNVYTYDRRWIS